MTGAPPERERNQLLRRVDWRFLLADSSVERILCLAGGDLRDGCQQIATYIDVTPNAEARYRLAVLADPDDRSLASVFTHLDSGGQVYCEFTDSSSAAIERRLESAGFRDMRCYAPWPEPPAAEIWVPLDAPQVFEYFERVDRHVYAGLRHRLGTRVRRSRARIQIARGASSRLCVIARKPAITTSRPDSPIVHAACSEAQVVPDGLTMALMTGGPRSISKVLGLAFARGAREPSFIIKWPRVAESEPGLRREADALSAAHSRGPAPGIPRLLARTSDGSPVAIAETAARGTPMFQRLTPKNVEALTRLGATWLADFNARERGTPIERGRLRDLTSREIQRFSETFGNVVDHELLELTSRLCTRLEEVPSVIEHRDFGPWNLFLDETRRITVLDWESSRLQGLPLLDLIYFISYMVFFADGAMVTHRFEDSYRATLDPRTAMGALREELVEQQREQLGLSTAAVRALRALCWVGHAESEYQAFCADAAGAPTPNALRKSVFARLWALELASLR